MHDRLFAGINEWSGKENALEVFKGYASELALDAAAFASCLDSGEMAAEVEAQAQEGVNRGARSIPTFFINDWTVAGTGDFESMFQPVIEKALSGQHPPPTPTPRPTRIPGPTPTPLPEGKSFTDPNPERPGYTYGNDAYLGSETAPILLFEFVNFGSADNRKYVLETWPELKTKYVDSGKARLMIKHIGLPEAPATVQAAEAAECAGQQQAFWGMFDLLFQRQDQWSKAPDVPATLKTYATELTLDAAAFAACLDGGQTKDKVEDDLYIGLDNQFPAAPVFFIFKGDQGGYVSTADLAQALEQFTAQ